MGDRVTEPSQSPLLQIIHLGGNSITTIKLISVVTDLGFLIRKPLIFLDITEIYSDKRLRRVSHRPIDTRGVRIQTHRSVLSYCQTYRVSVHKLYGFCIKN